MSTLPAKRSESVESTPPPGRKKRRSLQPLALLAPLLRATERISPALAARFAGPLMFRTARPPARLRELATATPAARFTVNVGRDRVAVARWGGAGPTVLLVHGWNGFTSQLAAFVPPLLDAGFQVVAFDAPGHGESSGKESSLIHFADALDAVAASAVGHGPVAGIIAHSFGCAASAFALDRRATGRAPTNHADLSATRLVFIASPIDIHEFSRSFSALLGLGDDTRASLDLELERRLGIPLVELDSLRIARRVRAPLLVIHDEDDRAVPVSSGKRLAAAWPGAELRLTQGLGHNRILRDPATIRRALDFVQSPAPDLLAEPA